MKNLSQIMNTDEKIRDIEEIILPLKKEAKYWTNWEEYYKNGTL